MLSVSYRCQDILAEDYPILTGCRRMGKILFSHVCVSVHTRGGWPHLHPIVLPLVPCAFLRGTLVTGPRFLPWRYQSPRQVGIWVEGRDYPSPMQGYIQVQSRGDLSPSWEYPCPTQGILEFQAGDTPVPGGTPVQSLVPGVPQSKTVGTSILGHP